MYINEENPEDDYIVDIDETISQLIDIKRILKEHEQEFPYKYDVIMDDRNVSSNTGVFFIDNYPCQIYCGFDYCNMDKDAIRYTKSNLIFFLKFSLYFIYHIITKKTKGEKIDIREKDVIHAKQGIKEVQYEDAQTSRNKYHFHLSFSTTLIISILIMLYSLIQYQDYLIPIRNIFVPMFIFLPMVLVFEIDLLWKRRKLYLTLKNTDETIQTVDEFFSPGPKDIIIQISKSTTYDYCIQELDSLLEFCIDSKNKGATHLSPPPKF